MRDIKISEGFALAHVDLTDPETIYLHMSEETIQRDRDRVNLYFKDSSKKPVNAPIVNVVLSLLEHETIHLVLGKIERSETSIRLDSSIKGSLLELNRLFNYWLKIDV
jgi:hypothetical protein